MRLSTGDKLGPYEITGLIGKGGMGEVYRASDTRLNRSVAIKVSSRHTIYEKTASGAGEEKELLTAAGEPKTPTSVSRDGHFLLYDALAGSAMSLWVLPLDGNHKPVHLLGTDFAEGRGSFSPDGRWIAYVSYESGRAEVYVRPFVSSGSSPPSLGEGKWQVSKDGATAVLPKWRNDGKEIVFAGITPPTIIAVDVNGSGAAFQMGTPKPLIPVPASTGGDMAGDGKRFLITVTPGAGQPTSTPITVVLNWQADLKK